jgi:hypothetical protein
MWYVATRAGVRNGSTRSAAGRQISRQLSSPTPAAARRRAYRAIRLLLYSIPSQFRSGWAAAC